MEKMIFYQLIYIIPQLFMNVKSFFIILLNFCRFFRQNRVQLFDNAQKSMNLMLIIHKDISRSFRIPAAEFCGSAASVLFELTHEI